MKIVNFVSLILVVLIFVSFFLPWVHIESQAAGRLTEFLTGKSQATALSVSGFNIPILANRSDSRLMISVIKIFNPDITNADKKSWLVWLVPVLAVILFLFSFFIADNRWFNLILAILGVMIFVLGFYKIATTDLDKVVLNLRIGLGVWLTLWGYLGLGLIGFINYLKILSQKKVKKG